MTQQKTPPVFFELLIYTGDKNKTNLFLFLAAIPKRMMKTISLFL